VSDNTESGAAPAAPSSVVEPSAARRDDFTKLTGVGPAYAKKLVAAGVRTFAEMADWTEQDIDLIDEKVTGGKGRVREEDWRGQARLIVEAMAISPTSPEDIKAALLALDPEDEPEDEPDAPPEPDEIVVAVEQPPEPTPAPARRVMPPMTVEIARQRRRLNRNEKFSDIYGNHHGALYSQMRNGEEVFFTQGGLEIVIADGEEASDVPDNAEGAEPLPETTIYSVNLLNWLDDRATYDYQTLVRPAIKRAHGNKHDFVNPKDAKKYLHEVLRGNN
jgi:hypothetical protein